MNIAVANKTFYIIVVYFDTAAAVLYFAIMTASLTFITLIVSLTAKPRAKALAPLTPMRLLLERKEQPYESI